MVVQSTRGAGSMAARTSATSKKADDRNRQHRDHADIGENPDYCGRELVSPNYATPDTPRKPPNRPETVVFGWILA